MAKVQGEVIDISSGSAAMLEDDTDGIGRHVEQTGDDQFADPTKDSVDDTTADAGETTQDEPAQDEPAQDAGDEIPAELLKKSPAELARMYRDLHKVVGRQGKELGDLRTLADNHIRATLAAQTAEAQRRAAAQKPTEPAPKPLDDADFFASPKTALERAIADHPEIKRLRAAEQEVRAAQVASRMAENKKAFEAAHPDAATILQDPGFREWIGESKIRQQMLVAADRNYDFAAGNELFSTWKRIAAAAKPAQQAAQKATAQKQVAARQAAKVPTGGNAGSAKSTGEKVYRRADLIRLQLNDPDRYEAMGAEIERAYREGRVR